MAINHFGSPSERHPLLRGIGEWALIEIGGVYTFPEFRKHGFGTKIVSDLACRIRTAGKTPTLQVDEQNIPALRLYESAGWKSMGKLARVWLTG